MPKAATFKPLTNRATKQGGKFTLPDDGFVMLVPKGEAPNILDDGSKDGKRIIQVVDETALGLMMSKLLNRAGNEMLIDSEHFSHQQDKATDANGWLPLDASTLQNREDGLYGDPRWSTAGLDKIEGGVLRYISPEFGTSTLEPIGGNRYRVTELTGLALTNRPGFKRLQKPLTNRDADGGIDNANTNTSTMHKALLAAHLGITESEVDKLDETTLKNRLSTIKDDAAKAVTYKASLDALHNREADEFMTKHDAVIPKNDKVREHLKQTFLSNRELAEGLVAGYSENDGEKLTPEQKKRAESKPIFNRETAAAPKGDASLAAAGEARAAQVSSRAKELCNREKKLSWSAAWQRASAEIPAQA